MIEDMTHLATLKAWAEELQAVLVEYNARCSGKTDKAELCAIRLEQNAEMTELLRKQRRHLAFMAGQKVEPEVQFAEVVLHGIGSLDDGSAQ